MRLFYVLSKARSSGLYFLARSRLLNLYRNTFLMFAMLVVAAALIRFNVVHSRASNEDQFDSEHVAKIFSEDDMTPDFTEQLGSHDHTTDIKKRNDAGQEKYGPPQNEARTTAKPLVEKTVKNSTARNLSEPNVLGRNAPGRNAPGRHAPEREGEKRHILHEEMDVVDREDHVTQYLSDQLVNTDSEITSLQASEAEDETAESVEVKEDSFFAFLTGQEKLLEVEGAWSRPIDDQLAQRTVDQEVNVISDVEYKD